MPPRTDRATGDTLPNPGFMRDSHSQPIRTPGQFDAEAMRAAQWAGIDEVNVIEPVRDDAMGRVIMDASVELEEEADNGLQELVDRAAARAEGDKLKKFDNLSPEVQRLVARAASHVKGSREVIKQGLSDDRPEQLTLPTEGMSPPSSEQQRSNAAAARRDHFWRAGRYQRRR